MQKMLFFRGGVNLSPQVGIVQHEAGEAVEKAEDQLCAVGQVAPLGWRIHEWAQDGAKRALSEDHSALGHARGEETPAVVGKAGLGEEVVETGDGC